MGLRARVARLFEPEIDQPSWATALQEIHERDGIVDIPEQESIDVDHPFVEGAELDVAKTRTAFEYLRHTGLIEPANGSGKFRIMSFLKRDLTWLMKGN